MPSNKKSEGACQSWGKQGGWVWRVTWTGRELLRKRFIGTVIPTFKVEKAEASISQTAEIILKQPTDKETAES
jgi:hypothetical protein